MSKIINDIKIRFQNAGIVEKLIYINLAVFILVFLANTFGFLFQSNTNPLVKWLSLPASFNDFLKKPWTIITYGFLHAGFLHILMNLIALFYIGNLFKQYFTPKQVLNFYIYGTIVGGILFLLSYNYFPVFASQKGNNVLLGASAGISAIFIGIATYMPNYEIKFPLIGFVKLWILGAIWVGLDILQIPMGNAGGRIAHLGGALFGFLYVQQVSNKELDVFTPIKNLFKKQQKPLRTVHKSSTKRTRTSPKSENQQQIDLILEKIGKSGYDSLTQTEKEFLFKQGK